MKKIITFLGAGAIATLPIFAIVSCSSSEPTKEETNKTSIKNNIDLGFSDIYASNAKDIESNIKSAIIPHITNILDGFILSENDIKISWEDSQFNNLEGKLTINITLIIGGQVNGQMQQNLDLGKKTFIGFKKFVPLNIQQKTSALMTDDKTKKASTWLGYGDTQEKKLKSFVIENQAELFNELYEELTNENWNMYVNSIQGEANNENKNVIFSISLNKIFDSNGIPTQETYDFNFMIFGFAANNNKTALTKILGRDNIFEKTNLINNFDYAFGCYNVSDANWENPHYSELKLSFYRALDYILGVSLTWTPFKKNGVIFIQQSSPLNDEQFTKIYGMSLNEMKEKDSSLNEIQNVKLMFSFKPISFGDYTNSEGVKFRNSPVFKYEFDLNLILNYGANEEKIENLFGEGIIFQICSRLEGTHISSGNLIKLSATNPDKWYSQIQDNNWSSLIDNK